MGTRHLINAITDEISEVFLGLGYTVVHGPEVETDYYNFTALNAPADHRAARCRTRSTCAIARVTRLRCAANPVLCRTQTSGVQVA